MSVVDWNMDHNHTIQAINLKQQPTNLNQMNLTGGDDAGTATPLSSVIDDPNDQTQTFISSFPQMWFTTFAEFEERLKEFESITGTQYNKLKGDKLRDDRPERQTLVYRRLTYACYHYGESRQNENSRNR